MAIKMNSQEEYKMPDHKMRFPEEFLKIFQSACN